MASAAQPIETFIQRLETIPAQQDVKNSNGVNLITQLSTDDSYNSPPTTSTRFTFSYQTNNNLNGNLLFPLNENTIKHSQKISWHNLLKYLRSQRIVKNIEIFKNFKRKANQNLNTITQQFPFEGNQMEIEKFPFKNNIKDNERNEIERKILTFPLIRATSHTKRLLTYNRKVMKGKNDKLFKVRVHQLNSKMKHQANLRRTLRKLSIDINLRKFSCHKANFLKANKGFPLWHNLYSVHRINKLKSFPLKSSQFKGKFPTANKSQNTKQQLFQFERISHTLQNTSIKNFEERPSNQNSIEKFPCQLAAALNSCVSKFPINNPLTEHEHSFRNNLGNLAAADFCKYPKTLNSLPRLIMTPNDRNVKNTETEHVLLQVQDAQVHIEQNLRSLTTNANKQQRPQIAAANGINNDVNLLVDINSINNTHPNEVGYYAENIERIQDAIFALFEKIQNSLARKYNSEHGSTNAADEYDHGNVNRRFASTPTMSTTSVRNTESNNHNKEVLYKKYDFTDLCDQTLGQIVECSDVRETLAETVDCGITKEITNSTGSFLVKSEEPTSPNSLIPNPLKDSKYTSLEDYSNASELLSNINAIKVNQESKNNLERDSHTRNIIDIQNKSNDLKEFTIETVLNTRESDLTIPKASEMTINRLKKKEPENNLQTSELNEMKFDMNRANSGLPSSVSERSLGKHDNVKTEMNSTKLSTAHARNHYASSYNPSLLLKNEGSSLGNTVLKRSTLPTPLGQDGITNHLPTNLGSLKSSTDLSKGLRRPSLSTSLLSVDLPNVTPLTAVRPSDKTALVSRGISKDSPLSDVLPERTRLRRQRRMRSQDSQDDAEDTIERLNRLKARISASLSEVKGVLKQYSTDAENENENQTTTAVHNASEIKQGENKEGPITFRFVKKIRRRSIFSEDDENEQKQAELEALKEATDGEKQLEMKDETDNCKVTMDVTLPTNSSAIVEVANEKPLEPLIQVKDNQPLLEVNEIKLETNFHTLKEENPESSETKSQMTIMQQQTPRQVPSELKSATKGAIPKMENDAIHDIAKKSKKKIIVKSKDSLRRASLAAMEGSKIRPAVKLAIPEKIQRRPSDSEAMVQKKSITGKMNTSGVVEEVTPKPNIVKVKKSSTKNNNNPQLATEQTKSKEEEHTIANAKSDNLIIPMNEDNKSIYADKNKNVFMPKQPETGQQQQINSAITRQTNLLLPMQLVINGTASLNEKTIKNSMLPPRQQQQQQQQQQQREHNQQATISYTTTNFISKDLQAKGVMLENAISGVLSSPTASETNGQIKRESVVQPQQEDFHDFLEQEATIIKCSPTNKQTEVKLVNQIGTKQLKSTDNNDNLEGSLESVQSATKDQQEKSTLLQQQVIATADLVQVKSNDDNNKHEDIKAKVSLKEPCIDKTTTSTHVEAEHHQQRTGDEQSLTNVDDTKAISSPHISISSTSDIIRKTTTASLLSSASVVEEKKAEVSAHQQKNTMPELQLTPAPVQTADIISHPELHKKNTIIKDIVLPTPTDKLKKPELVENTKSTQITIEPSKKEAADVKGEPSSQQETIPLTDETNSELAKDLSTEECSESTEVTESSTSIFSEQVAATQKPKKERKVKRKVIIKREKRRLSVGDNFFRAGTAGESQNAEIETLEKPISYVSDDESEQSGGEDEESKKTNAGDEEEARKPLKSCILHKEYNIGDEVLYAERFKKTQIKWRRGRIKERITSISYLLDIEGKDVSSHINYLKKFTGRKVSFGGKEYLEIDYEQLAEEEEKAEKLQRRTYSIWNMV